MNIIASKLSPRVVNAIAIVLAAVLVALIALAITTRREVVFWPPRIGPDRSLLNQMEQIRQKLDLLTKNEQLVRLHYIEQLEKARSASLSAQAFLNAGTPDARRMEAAADEGLQRQEKLIANEIKTLHEQFDQLMQALQ